ncbi:MAG: hypothetical protein ABSH06_20555 [Thermodesulfobacteriota bacterium]
MLKDRIMEMFKEYDENIREVVGQVMEKEREKLSQKNPIGIIDDIRKIIDNAAKRLEDED